MSTPHTLIVSAQAPSNAQRRCEVSAYLAAATRIARTAARRYDTAARTNGMVESEDLASEGLMAMREAELAGRWPKSPTGFLKAVIASKAVALGSSIAPEDRRAIKRLHRLQASEETRLGRLLTTRERDALAASVRDTWEDRRHLPSADFATRIGSDYTVSLDSPAASDVEAAAERSADMASARGRALEEWLISSDRNGAAYDARRARSLAYNAYAEITGAPAVIRHLSEAAAARARRCVEGAGGVRTLAESWWEGRSAAQGAEALFAPLGTVDEDARRRFVDALLRRPDGADQVWDLAIRAATRRRA